MMGLVLEVPPGQAPSLVDEDAFDGGLGHPQKAVTSSRSAGSGWS